MPRIFSAANHAEETYEDYTIDARRLYTRRDIRRPGVVGASGRDYGQGNYRAGKVSQKTLAKHARGRTVGRAHSGYGTAGRYIADYRRRLLAVL